jgi:glycosyltransferase involved in cell wall biosynthesis
LVTSFDALVYPDSVAAELLIVDNGSTDDTARVLARAATGAKRFPIRVLKEERQGKSNALNRGLSAAAGKILLVVDDDVVVHPEWLIKHLESHGSSRFDALCGAWVHGLCGMLVRDQVGERAAMAGDVLSRIPEALSAVER